jgi:hypothetical protein
LKQLFENIGQSYIPTSTQRHPQVVPQLGAARGANEFTQYGSSVATIFGPGIMIDAARTDDTRLIQLPFGVLGQQRPPTVWASLSLLFL